MRDQILQFPKQLLKGTELAKSIRIEKNYERVVVCGMGGSIIAGEILLAWQETTGDYPAFYVHRDYDLPAWVSANELVVCISWSGNTEETLSCYEAAIKTGIPVVSITNGGKLSELASQNKTPLILIRDEDLKPRMAVGYMTAALFQLVGLEEEIISISLDPEKLEETGKTIAEKIGEMTPLIYSSYKWCTIPRFWKILFNENAKIHSFWNYLPGMGHNELVGFTDKAQVQFFSIFFRDAHDDKRQNKNIDATIAILNDLGYNYRIVDLDSSSNKFLETVLNNYILGLWASYYLAKNLGVDPEDTGLIEEFKDAKKRL